MSDINEMNGRLAMKQGAILATKVVKGASGGASAIGRAE
jgi:hypothetical protein